MYAFVTQLRTRSPRWAYAIGFVIGTVLLAAPQLARSQATTYAVNSTVDVADSTEGDGACTAILGGDTVRCTLRAAIQEANATAARDTISFENIPTTEDGFASILLDGDLGTLEVTEDVLIDGGTAPGYPSASADGPIVKVDGSDLTLSSGVDILNFSSGADGSRVEGLAFVGAPGQGISVDGKPAPDNVTISNCFVGIDVDGTTVQGNGSHGIFIRGSGSRVIFNLVSGNGEAGIHISGDSNGIYNNTIGLDHDRDASRGNAGHGVHVFTGTGNTIGDVSEGFIVLNRGNTIAGNNGAGVFIEADKNNVFANLIGTDGSSAFPNSNGVVIQGPNSTDPAEGNRIGSGDDIDQNTISGNQFNGIQLGNGANNQSANNNVINNNKVGTGTNGTNEIPNGNGSIEGGIRIDEGDGNEILDNVISGNNANGIRIRGQSTGNTIAGNRIGVDVNNDPLGNDHWGILVQSDFSNIGGFSSGEENIIGANANAGIRIEGNSNSIENNFVGVTSAGASIGNGANGIFLGGDKTLVQNNTIGNNGGAGIQLKNASESFIQANYIGINADGDSAPNQGDGVYIEATSNDSASANAITSAVEISLDPQNANVIANNQGDGVRIGGDGTALRNAVRGNRIFNNAELGIDLNDDERTANDAGDGDDGPNRLRNFPELQSSVYDPDSNTVTLTYLVPSDPDGGAEGAYPFEIDVFVADAEKEEGKEYLDTNSYSSNDYAACGSPPCTVTVAFTPESAVTQGDEIVATATDDEGNTSEFSASVTVEFPNAPPVAEDDSAQTREGEAVTTEVLANDADPDGELAPSTVRVESGPSDGTASENDDGTIAYDPDAGFAGTDSYTYTVADTDGARSGTATVTIEVTENAQPTARFTVDPSVPEVGESVSFDGGESSDPDGSIAEYRWDFDGDGEPEATGPTASTAFSSAGEKTVALTVEDDAGAFAERPSTLTVRAAELQVSTTRSFGGEDRSIGDENTLKYRLVALPGAATGTVSETAPGYDWRGFREEGAVGPVPYSRVECSGNCRFGPGKGFWLIAGQQWEVDRSVSAVPLDEDAALRLEVHGGWNIVSNPLEIDVPWSAVQEATGTSQSLWEWTDGRWREAEIFRSAKDGVAYYFMDNGVSELTVPFSRTNGSSAQAEPASAKKARRDEQRSLTLSILRDETVVSSVKAGVQSGGAEGLDRFDIYGPPGYFGGPILRLTEQKEGRRYMLVTEYQASGGEGHSFDLRLQADSDTALTLRASGVRAFAEQEILLVEQGTGRSYDLRERSEVRIVLQAEEMRFRLLVGSSSFVEKEHRKITPKKVELMPNYPNPFQEGTTIEYALPEAQHVRLEVYDVLGRRVDVLVKRQQRAGFHRVQWRGGGELSSGVYFYRLRLEGTTKMRKMTVVR